jgi:SOS regulatory protein LexA
MPMNYNKLFALMKSRGLSTYRIRKDNILSQSTLQKLREKKSVTTDAIATLCQVLNCQPCDLMEYENVSVHLTKPKQKEYGRVIEVPILGNIAAGIPITAIENLDGFIEYLPHNERESDDLFALRVKGTSMIDAGIYDGDIVIVEQTSYAENGQIVAAMIYDEATVKRFYKEKGHYRLQPENPDMEPIIVPEVQILGRVVSSMRYY